MQSSISAQHVYGTLRLVIVYIYMHKIALLSLYILAPDLWLHFQPWPLKASAYIKQNG